jgi:peptidyl-tRNA hydrolase
MMEKIESKRYIVRYTDAQRNTDGRRWYVVDTGRENGRAKIVARASSQAMADELAEQFNKYGGIKRI